jgi:hypothetical protein
VATIVPRWLDELSVDGGRVPAAVEPEALEAASGDWSRSFQARLERLSSLMASRPSPLAPAMLSTLESLLSQAEEMVLKP